MAVAVVEPSRDAPTRTSVRTWLPHIWLGCGFWTWTKLLVRNRFRVHWRLWHVAVIGMFVCPIHSLLGFIQWLVYGRRIRRTFVMPPIFILGHWRTGTTLLHELLSLDQRFTFPTSYQCFLPTHFLLTERFASRYLWFMTPTKRPMDNMAAGWNRPQEDEFALCMLGTPSPYLTMAFPNRGPMYGEYLDLEGVRPRALKRWKQTFLWFLQVVTLRARKRLVLKSPPHTCRLRVLKEMFPNAIFVHIVRNPYVVFPSTLRLWKSLYFKQGLQLPTFAGLEKHILETYVRMHITLEETRHLIDDDHFYELRYEDLVRDPIGELRALYEHLNLGEFHQVLSRLENYLESVAGYETNRYRLTSRQREEITRHWGATLDRYGYNASEDPKGACLRRAG